MGIINVLESHVANMIAAGEVVENPASVVKELLENAIDAKANSVNVEIQSGGVAYIRVTDDGCGMSLEDAKTSFLRHATSKISKADDLDGISTLGFRGEALAAISAVSKIDLITKSRNAEMGCALRVEAGSVVRESDSGCPDGTTIIVRELFYNTPARMRFLKKDATEAAYVENVIKATALSHPEIAIKFIRDGKDVLHTPGDGVLKNTMYALFGRDFANNMNEVLLHEKGMSVRGFTCTPQASRGNRGLQFFFVNGRAIKSKMISVALDNAYKELLMKGRFSTCVIMLEIPHTQVDVNVHPAKTEVKFARERDVFDVVYFAVKSALSKKEEKTPPPPPVLKPAPYDNVTENQVKIDMTPPRLEFKVSPIKLEPMDEEIPPSEGIIPELPKIEKRETERTVLRSTHMAEYDLGLSPEKKEALASVLKPEETSAVLEKTEEITPKKPLRLIGEAMNTYIIVEYGDSVVFIDKHAAHERIIFEKLQKTVGTPSSQMLLTPEVIDLDKSVAAAIVENREEIEKIGFEVDEFGDGSVAVSAIPEGIDVSDAIAVLEDIAETLKSGARTRRPDILSETMYSVACKAAIKAGQKNAPEELLVIAERVLFEDDIRFCPHGRPVMIEYSKSDLEKKFKRIV